MLSDADLAPTTEGVNVTLMVQLPPFAVRLAGQLFVCEKSPGFVPVMLMLEMVSPADPAFVRTIARETLELPAVTFPNARLPGASDATGAAGDVPVPVSGTFCMLPVPPASLVSVRDAERAAATVGVKVTPMLQLDDTLRLAGQLLVCEKSPGFVPVNPIPEIASGAVPLLVRTTDMAVLEVLIV